MFITFALLLSAQEIDDTQAVELPVEPYEQQDENAGAKPFIGNKMAIAFGGKEGIRRIAEATVELSENDPRIAEIFMGTDLIRLRRTLYEQFCYILNAGCTYSGRDMNTVHKDMGTQMADLNALIENLQIAMQRENIPFALQNRFLSKLAPMSKDVVSR